MKKASPALMALVRGKVKGRWPLSGAAAWHEDRRKQKAEMVAISRGFVATPYNTALHERG
ncbi:hypothetical protein [Sphingomonas psychrolutea]|uniref:hypothetical protein n=1 Tax=Sphingomonas psychrolutea TaxID=1259676 RepID=UPI001668D957|nr:hypothetical protein [Sphingomonas psychrolutea]